MTKLLPFQFEDVICIEKLRGRALLASEMGTGKTIIAAKFIKRNRPKPVLIICPAHLKYHWQRELERHCGLYSEIIEGRKVPKGRLTRVPKILIVNYDILQAWEKYLEEFDPELIVIDEGHYVKSPGAKRTKITRKLCKKAPCLIVITGTPFTNRPAELWSVLNMLWPEHYRNFFPFAHAHCNPRLRRWGWEFKGAVRLDQLHEQLRKRGMIRRLKKDVMKELPAKSTQTIPVEITNEREYREAETQFITWMRKKYSVAKARRAAAAQRLVQIGYLKRLAAQGKLKAIFEWIDNFLEESDGKLIVFAIHRAMISTLMERYGKIAVKIDGQVTGAKRQQAVDIFSKSKKCRLLFGNVKAAGTGWNGTAASTTLVVEFPWSPGDLNQALARMDRIGQKFPMTSIFLVAKGTIEEKLCALLEEKQKILSATLDGDARIEALNIIDQLTKSLLRKKAA